MDPENAAGSGIRAPKFNFSEPEVISQFIAEFKSSGLFDEIRRDCLAEADSKPAYGDLQSRIGASMVRFLNKKNHTFKPTLSKTQLRTEVRNALQREDFVTPGIEKIVDQTVNPRIYSIIEPAIEKAIIELLGVNMEDLDNDIVKNGNQNQVPPEESKIEATSPSKMSAISSEDVDMGVESEASSTGGRLRGHISPLTPERQGTSLTNHGKSDESDSELAKFRRGFSPLTPPLKKDDSNSEDNDSEDDDSEDDSPPRTPPLPPPQFEDEDEEMSPVSDVELEEVSPPLESQTTPAGESFATPPEPADGHTPPPPLPPSPPPPPPPSYDVMTPPPPPRPRRPRSPLTSPIGSSSDEMETGTSRQSKQQTASSVSASDISDTDFACQSESEKVSSEEIDIEDLEKQKAELQAQLKATHLDDASDEGELQSDEEMVEKKVDQPEKDLLSISPISEAEKSEEEEAEEQKPDSELKPEPDRDSRDRDDDDGSANAPGGAGESGNDDPPPDQGSNQDEQKEPEGKEHHSQDQSRNHKSHRHHSTSSSKDDKHRHSSHKSSKHKKRDKDRRDSETKDRRDSETKDRRDSEKKDRRDSETKDRRRDDSRKDRYKSEGREKKESKDSEKEREMKREKERIMLEKINSTIIKKSAFKCEKMKEINMFEPKAKPKVGPMTPRLDRSNSGNGSPSLFSPHSYKSSSSVGNKPQSSAPVTPTSATPKSSKNSKEDVFFKGSSKTDKQEGRSDKPKPAQPAKSDSDRHREVALSATSPSFERRVLPELPVPKCDGDKQQQHSSDIEETKRLLNYRKQKILAEEKALEAEKKKKKKTEGKPLVAKSAETPKQKHIEHVPAETSKSRRTISEDDSDSDGEWQKKSKSAAGHKKRKSSARKRFSDSSSGEEEEVAPSKEDNPVMTRKLMQTTQADIVLKDDPGLSLCHGFTDVDVFSFDIEEDALDDSSDIEDLIPLMSNRIIDTNLIYLDKLSNPEKVLQSLKPYGGKPKLVRTLPNWLTDKLTFWSLKRQDVDIIYPNEMHKIRNKKNFSFEKKYDAKFGVPRRIEDILSEQMPDIVNEEKDVPSNEEAEVPVNKEEGSSVKEEVGATENDRAIASDNEQAKASDKEEEARTSANVQEETPVQTPAAKRALKRKREKSLTKPNAAKSARKVFEPAPVHHEVSNPDVAAVEVKDKVMEANGVEEFHGFTSDQVPPANKLFDSNGYTFNLHPSEIDEIITDVLQHHERLMELRIDEEFEKHFGILFSRDRENLKAIKAIQTHKVPVVEKVTKSTGLIHVYDEFLPDDPEPPAPKRARKSRAEVSTPEITQPRVESTSNVPGQVSKNPVQVYQLPPSPISSPTENIKTCVVGKENISEEMLEQPVVKKRGRSSQIQPPTIN